MNKTHCVFSWLLKCAGIFALVCCGVFFIELARTAKELQTTARDTSAAVKEVQKRVADTSQNLNAALIQVGLATDEARRASVEQRQYWNKISRETIGLIADADQVIKGLNETQAGIGRDLHGTAEATGAALREIPPLLKDLQTTATEANRLIADPDITRSIKGMADASQQIAATTANVEKMSEDVQKRIHQMTQPKSFAKVVLGWLLDTAYKVKALL